MSKLKKALERAKIDREIASPLDATEPRPSGTGVNRTRTPHKESQRKDLDFEYVETEILNIDPATLQRNKVFSHRREEEMSDQISILKIQILNSLDAIGGSTLMVTSANPGEGKTFTSINLGVSIAQELDKTVLIVDCDLRKPDPTHFDFSRDFFGVEVERGLSDYLLGKAEIAEILLNPGIPRLTIIPGGKPLLNSSELLGSPKMEMLINEMNSRYGKNRIIIFDSPAIIRASDPLTFSKYVDGILLVVESERTSANDIKKMMNLLKGKTIVGTILNKFKGA